MKEKSKLQLLKEMVEDNPVTLEDHLEWIEKYGLPKGEINVTPN